MNRILRRPMFRIGGSTGTGITSGLDQPKAKRADFTIDDAMREEDRKLREALAAYERYKMSGGTMTFEQFIKMTGTGSFNTGGRVGYQQGSMPTFQAAGLPGFLTSLGLNILATPPQGNIFATTATAARDPFAQLQADQAASRKTLGEQKFIRDERIAGDEASMERLKLKLESDERLAGNKNDPLYNVMLEQYIENDLPPQVAKRAAAFSTTEADNLRNAVKNRYGGVLQFDVRDPSNQNLVKKNLKNKVVYDPFDNNYKYIVIRDGEIYFDEFNSIEDIKFPTIGAEETEQQGSTQTFGDSDVFSPRIEDASP